MSEKVSKVFKERPEQWGLRGDPYLWDDFEKHFSNISIPISEDSFRTELNSAFETFTGTKLDSKEYIHIPNYSFGGMSSGMVCPEFWLNEAIPILLKRLKDLNQENNK